MAWIQLGSDVLILLAYLLFFLGILYFLITKRDVPYRSVYLLFAAFLVLGGITAVIKLWTYVQGYRGMEARIMEGKLKFLPAISLIFVALLFWRLMPRILKKSGPEDSRDIVQKLNEQIAAHKRAEEYLLIARKENEGLRNEITVRRLSQEPLQRSQENFETIINSIEGVVWEFDLSNARYSFVSKQVQRILGYPAEIWLSEPTFWQDHVHGGDREPAVAFRARVAREKTDDQFEYRMVTSDGRTRWLRDMATAVVEDGQVVKLRGVMVDITEQKIVEEFLNHERNFVSTILETASALVLILDPRGRIVRFNRACQQVSGYSAEEAKEKFFWELFSSPVEADNAKAVFTRLLAGQFPINYDSQWTGKDGTSRMIGWSDTVLLNRENVPVNIIATGIDITRIKDAEEKLKNMVERLATSNKALDDSSRELQEANERLKKLDRIKSDFISAASHELRTPLTSLKGFVEAILYDEVGPLNEKQRQFLTYVAQSADRLHRLVNELLDISKIESGQVRMNKNLSNIKNLLHEVITIFKPQAEGKSLSLELNVDGNLREIFCDADKIREVMDNLLSNAVKYTLPEGKIKILAKNADEGIRIEVQDTGIGIKAEDLPRVFEPFQNIEKTGAEGEESAGLGLTLSKKIVQAHGGEIQVKSRQGKGSTFTVLLPSGKMDLAIVHG